MIQKRIWTKSQLPQIAEIIGEQGISQDVMAEIEMVVQILDCHYGEMRNADSDDGGYILFLLSENYDEVSREYEKLLEMYHLHRKMAEFEDVICCDCKGEWHSDLYLAGSEYGITVIYPVKERMEK